MLCRFWLAFNFYIIYKVKQSYAEIRNEARELGNLQREMALAFQKDLLSTVQKLQVLTESGEKVGLFVYIIASKPIYKVTRCLINVSGDGNSS